MEHEPAKQFAERIDHLFNINDIVKVTGKMKGSLYSYDVKDNEFYSGVYEVEQFLKNIDSKDKDLSKKRNTLEIVMYLTRNRL